MAAPTTGTDTYWARRAKETAPLTRLKALLAAAPLGLAALVASTTPALASPAPTPATQLAQKYLSALAPAGRQISKVEAALKALGPSTTASQVRAAVAALGPAIAPVEALLTAPPPTTLEALGQPQIEGPASKLPYRAAYQGAHLYVGNTLYPNGFQWAASSSTDALVWQLHGRYTTLSFQLGVDQFPEQGSEQGIVVLDSTGTYLPLTYQGKLVLEADVTPGGLRSFTVNVAHESEVKLALVLGGSGMLDVVNDRLT